MEENKNTTNAHNPRDYKIRWSVCIIPILFFAIVLLAGILIPDAFNTVIDKGVMLVMKDMGWAVSLCTLFLVVFCLAIVFVPVGKVRLGGPKAKPELSTFEYFALSLCAGMATGFILWPTAEMIEYTARPPVAFGAEPMSYESIIDALEYEWLHWAWTPYALYTAFGVVVTYAIYNLGKSYRSCSALYPLMGERMGNGTKTVVDIICLFAILGGVSGSMGYGLMQLGSGIEYLFHIKTGLPVWIAIAVVITIIYTATSVSGLKKGIAWLSEKNTYLFFFFLAFVILFSSRTVYQGLPSYADCTGCVYHYRSLAPVVEQYLVAGLDCVRTNDRFVYRHLKQRPYLKRSGCCKYDSAVHFCHGLVRYVRRIRCKCTICNGRRSGWCSGSQRSLLYAVIYHVLPAS